MYRDVKKSKLVIEKKNYTWGKGLYRPWWERGAPVQLTGSPEIRDINHVLMWIKKIFKKEWRDKKNERKIRERVEKERERQKSTKF